MSYPQPPVWVRDALHEGQVIPAHPLALTPDGSFDERRQRALTRYYHAAGAGGLAVGVHTTQFEIRDPEHDLYVPVLDLAAETVRACDEETGRRTILIAGVCGPRDQAVAEARQARDLGYHVALLSLAGLEADTAGLVAHCRAVAEVMPLMGFYLQPAVGGRVLEADFWRAFAGIPNAVAIKVAPFDRYRTLDVLRGVAASGRAGEIALYTGNDDHILLDLLTTYRLPGPDGLVDLRFAGGLLGHWAVWTHRAAEHLARCKAARAAGRIDAELLTLAAQVTESNAVLFDAANGFAGCIPGIHHALARVGLLDTIRCLDPGETLSEGQAEAIERVVAAYPHLTDDAFVEAHRAAWNEQPAQRSGTPLG